jgi:hypothetical protein
MFVEDNIWKIKVSEFSITLWVLIKGDFEQ